MTAATIRPAPFTLAHRGPYQGEPVCRACLSGYPYTLRTDPTVIYSPLYCHRCDTWLDNGCFPLTKESHA